MGGVGPVGRAETCDKVALLQNGTITHVGSHHDLLETVPAYRSLLAADADEDDDLAALGGEVVRS